MSVIIFIIILGLLIFVHELGHFLIAKWSKIRVDEFAVGFPPKIFSFMRGGTKYALNLIPFGGYVKIFGENPDEESLNPEAKDSFVNKNRWIQAAVLVAGVTFNIIFAWMLISASYMISFPTIVTDENINNIENPRVVIGNVAPESPAEDAGIRAGYSIESLKSGENILSNVAEVEDVQKFIADNSDSEIIFNLKNKNESIEFKAMPEDGLVEGKKTVGIVLAKIGDLKLGFFDSMWQGFKTTGILIKEVSIGLYTFFGNIIKGDPDFSQVAGPVGIVGHVDDASKFGFAYLLTFTAMISINLAIINLVPFPALDGGRLLFVAIEGITRRRIKTSVANAFNLIGFALLMLLMMRITIMDRV